MIKVLAKFRLYEEYRAWQKEYFDIIHMLSYYSVFKISKTLSEIAHESHEIQNSREPD
jgi:hypothetical protein